MKKSTNKCDVQAANGVIVQIGANFVPHSVNQVVLMMKNLGVAGSAIGGLPATQVISREKSTLLVDTVFLGLHRFLLQT